jgi:formate dehydrogenase iron-sulfur subunit
MDLGGDTRLLISFHEEAGGDKGVMWAFGRRSCMHCYNPACASVCPSGALYVDDGTGLVTVAEDKCIGCRYCSSACPFDVPRYHGPHSKVNKCTGCVDRVAQGRPPACVKTCQPTALKFGERDEMLAIARQRVEYLKGKGFTNAAIYGEDELEGLHVIVVSKYDPAWHGLPLDPKKNALIDLLALAKPLAAVGVGATVLGLGASFLSGLGYKRAQLHYDETTGETIDLDTDEVVLVDETQEGR